MPLRGIEALEGLIEIEASTGAGTPVPDTPTVCGFPAALSAIVILPVRDPVAVGANVTLMVQLPPATTVVPQVLICEKSPVATMFVILRSAVPVFESVMF